MLTPRFTLRMVLKGVTICAIVALITGRAVAGENWAIAATIAICGAIFFFLVYAASYALMRLIPVPEDSPRKAKPLRTIANTKQQPRSVP